MNCSPDLSGVAQLMEGRYGQMYLVINSFLLPEKVVGAYLYENIKFAITTNQSEQVLPQQSQENTVVR